MSHFGVELRPHMKTIHLPELAEKLRLNGLSKISVSNLGMLTEFAKSGWRDICLALPFPVHMASDIHQIVDEYKVRLTVYVDHFHHLDALDKFKTPVTIAIEVDAGQARSGVDWKQLAHVESLMNRIELSPHAFGGISSHFGHHYDCENREEILQASSYSMMRILQIKESLDAKFNVSVPLAIGDTPSLYSMAQFDLVDEIRAGNFLLNDMTMVAKGLCDLSHVAVYVEANVIGKYDDDCRLVLHCGAVHLSKEHHADARYGFGVVSSTIDDPNILDQPLIITELYQEHAVVVGSADRLQDISIGNSLFIYPVHACLAVDAMLYKSAINIFS